MRRSTGILVLAALCGCVFLQGFLSMRTKSLTYDELAYIPAGYSYVITGDLRLNPEQPPLPKLLAGAALLPLAPGLPVDHSSWRRAGSGTENLQWEFGREFLSRAVPDVERIVLAARLPSLFLTVLLVLGVFLFARDLYGRRAGLLAAGLCAFSPNILAHGRLATTDLAVTVFVLLSVYCYHRFTREPTASRLLVAGSAFGLALLSKFSAVFLFALYPLWAVILPLVEDGVRTPEGADGGDWWRRFRDPRWNRVLFSGSAVLALFLVAMTVTSLGYLAPGRFDLYLRDLAMVNVNVSRVYPFYFHGEFSTDGIPQYFLAAVALKTPLALLLLLLLRLGASLLPGEAPTESVAQRILLFSPVAIFLAVISWKAYEIGLRYVLPVYPFLFVYAAGVLRTRWVRRLPGRLAVAGLMAWFAVSSLAAHPHYLPYFNSLAGGPRGGIEWLDDSNIDWGQDLLLLRDYVRREGVRDLRVAFSGQYDPAVYGIRAEWMSPREAVETLTRPDPPPGVYAVGVHILNRARIWEEAPVQPLEDLHPTAVLGHTIYVYSFPGAGGPANRSSADRS